MIRSLLSAAALFLALPAAAETYAVDAAHSHVGFKVRHMMVSYVRGSFGDVSGTVVFDPENPQATSADITIQVGSIDTGNADRDAHLRNPDFFDVDSHPTMTFVSRRVRRARADGFELVGDLTIRGVTREVSLAVSDMTPETTDPWGNQRRGAHATATIDRQDFGVSWNNTLDAGGVVVGDEVTIEIDVEITRQ